MFVTWNIMPFISTFSIYFGPIGYLGHKMAIFSYLSPQFNRMKCKKPCGCEMRRCDKDVNKYKHLESQIWYKIRFLFGFQQTSFA